MLGVRIPPGLPANYSVVDAEIKAMLNKVMPFLNEVRSELKKITWPSRDELVGSTIIVCVIVAIFALILGAMDATFSAFIKYLISY